jgi:protein TonB
MEEVMFEQSLLEVSSTKRANRPLATVVSFTLQSILIGILVLIPLLHTQALPARDLVTFLVAPAPPPPPPPPPAAVQKARVVRQVQSDIAETAQLKTPIRIPEKIQMLKEEAPPPVMSVGGVVGGVPGGIPGGQLGGVIGGIIGSTSKVAYLPPPPKRVVPKRIRVSQGVTRGLLIHRVRPVYPAIARQARVQGTVLLQAIIAKDGSIQNLQAVSGHPMLVPAAIAAVREWRYKPYLLNGQPVEVETQVSVIFTLG